MTLVGLAHHISPSARSDKAYHKPATTTKKSKSQPFSPIAQNQEDPKFEYLRKHQGGLYEGKMTVVDTDKGYWGIKKESAVLERTAMRLKLKAAEKELYYHEAKYNKLMDSNDDDGGNDI
ncbi:hypothetical protein QAD02_007031 [Eretmocerus hayati]|uniref:Uncharacterized protein n=1 Tax=Eretmocerus hayati TaxID=131215 RepID=A0ACC2N2S5_9HYME|nr:hypothetical protein QAD02_007031 [Eretmocerus hayati]